MPFSSSIEGSFGYGRSQIIQSIPVGNLPTYYTSSSGFIMNQPGYTAITLQLKTLANISSATVIRTYSSLNAAWTTIHDKDLDSNVWYNMPEGSRILYKYTLAKGGTSITTTNLGTYTGASTSVLGACYAPAIMWGNTTSYGAFIIGGFSQAVLHVLEFNSTKSGWSNTYTVSYPATQIYGTEIIPKAASGFTQDFGVAYSRTPKTMASWTVNMATRSWTNLKDNTYTAGINGPSNGCGMIYYPIGKPIFTNDPDTSTNRLAMNDTSSSSLYVWTVTQSGNDLVWTYLKTVNIGLGNAYYPYNMSQNTYDSIA